MRGAGSRPFGARIVVSADVGVLPTIGAIAAFVAVRDTSWIDLGPLPAQNDPASLGRFAATFDGVESQTMQHPSVVWAGLAAVAVAGLFVLSILLHELGHAWAARRVGLDVDTLELGGAGGFVTFHDDDRLTAGRLAFVVAAGPAATAVVTAVSLGALLALGWPVGGAPDAESSAGVVAQEVLGTTFVLNALCLGLNLVPVRPLDGGHLLVALRLWTSRSGR